MAFRALEDVRRPKHVVDQVLASIHSGSLRPGDRLPSESKLAELTGVGRTSVREALTALRLMGIVETRVGDGTYVRADARGSDRTERMAETIALSTEAFQLQEARAAFETGIVRYAADRWTEGKSERAARLLDRMSAASADGSYDDYVRLHRALHLEIARATDNDLIVRTEERFLEFMDHEGWRDLERQFYLPDRGEALRASVEEHRAIVAAISAGDGPGASARMHEHFVRHDSSPEEDRG